MRSPFHILIAAGALFFAFLIGLFARSTTEASNQVQDDEPGFAYPMAWNCNASLTPGALGMLRRVPIDPQPAMSIPLYIADVCVNRGKATMIVDRQQSDVLLTWNQAVELDLKPNRMTFDAAMKINGRSQRAAKVTLDRLRIGEIEVTNVAALIARDDELDWGVLGQSFLNRLSGVAIKKNKRLVLVSR